MSGFWRKGKNNLTFYFPTLLDYVSDEAYEV